jgi:hypothetical protein
MEFSTSRMPTNNFSPLSVICHLRYTHGNWYHYQVPVTVLSVVPNLPLISPISCVATCGDARRATWLNLRPAPDRVRGSVDSVSQGLGRALADFRFDAFGSRPHDFAFCNRKPYLGGDMALL